MNIRRPVLNTSALFAYNIPTLSILILALLQTTRRAKFTIFIHLAYGGHFEGLINTRTSRMLGIISYGTVFFGEVDHQG